MESPLDTSTTTTQATTTTPMSFNTSDPMSYSNSTSPIVGPVAAEGGVAGLPCLKDWISVLFECFVIITLGYLSSRFRLISPEAKDLNSYLAKFALPMIIFLNIAQMDYQSVNWSFLTCILIAKSVIFISTSLLTLIISRPTNFGYAGSLSILVTQSNDFALGYPLIKSLYGEEHSDMLSYLSLQAPIQLLIFNPLGIAMLEYEKTRQARRQRQLEIDTISSRTTDNDSFVDSNNDDKGAKNCTSPAIGHTSHSHEKQTIGQKQVDSLTTPRLRPSETNSKQTCQHMQHSRPDYKVNNNIIINNLLDCKQNRNHNHDQLNNYATHDNNNNPAITNHQNISSDNKTNEGEIIYINDHHNRIKDVECKLQRQLRLIRARSVSEVDHSNLVNDSPSSTVSNSTLRTDLLLDSSNSNYSSTPSLLPDEMVTGANKSINEQSCIVNYCSSNNTLISTELTQHIRESPKTDFSFLISLAKNPLILASVIALCVNRVHGPELPKYITRVSTTIAASFASPALFVIGLSMFGKFKLLFRNPSDLMLSLSLVITKLLILPNLMRLLTMIILPRYLPADESSYLKDFSYLYGSLPTAPTAVLIAQQYSVLTNVVSISMLLSTVLSAPLLLGVALIINPAGNLVAKQVINTADIS